MSYTSTPVRQSVTSLPQSPITPRPSLTSRPGLSPRGSYRRNPYSPYSNGNQRPTYHRSPSSRSSRQRSISTTNARPAFRRSVSSKRKVQFPFRFTRARSLRRGAGALSLNELLTYHPGSSFVPLEYDLSLDPVHILICHTESNGSYSRLNGEHFSAPATTPQLSKIHISCKYLPQSIEIHPVYNSRSITIGDIIYGLYRALRGHASGADWSPLPKDAQRRVRNAWRRRYKRQGSSAEREYEERQGLRWVDFLEGNSGFRGLSSGHSIEHWVMHVGPLKKHVKFRADS